VLTTAVLAILAMSMLSSVHFVAAQPNANDYIDIVNPGPASYASRWTAGPDVAYQGSSNFIFSTTDTSAGDTFFLNITIGNNVQSGGISNLFGWGIGLAYDNSTLQYVNAWLPGGAGIFNGAIAAGASLIAPAPVIAPFGSEQEIKWGATFTQPSPTWTFNGSGVAAQIEFSIIPQASIVNSNITAAFSFDPAWTGLYFYPSGSETPPSFITGTGYFEFDWIQPTTIPYFYIVPSTYSALTVGELFNISVYVGTVDPAWSIIGFQFGMWFNEDVIAPVNSYPGTWINGFCTNLETPISAATDDYLYPIDLSLPGPGYNEWIAFQAIVPGTGGLWYPPFPSGGGILYTFEFQAIVGTLFPTTLTIPLTLHDMEIYNAYDQPIAIGTPGSATYTAPLIITGRSIDLYDQYPSPYGGQGPGNPSDTFAPQALVNLYANVTYNGGVVQQKPVAFEIQPPATATELNGPIYLSAFSDSNGIAMVSYRIPWPCVDPQQVLGIWTVTATVEIAQGEVMDTMQFEVQYPVFIMSIVSNDTYVQSKYNLPEPVMKFTVTYETYQMQTGFQTISTPNANLPPSYTGEGVTQYVYNTTVYYNSTVLETVDAFDNLGFFIGSAALFKLIPVTSVWDLPNVWTDTFVIPLTTNAVIGQGMAYADAFSQYPINGGVPYCPEADTTFEIVLPT